MRRLGLGRHAGTASTPFRCAETGSEDRGVRLETEGKGRDPFDDFAKRLVVGSGGFFQILVKRILHRAKTRHNRPTHAGLVLGCAGGRGMDHRVDFRAREAVTTQTSAFHYQDVKLGALFDEPQSSRVHE